MKLLAIVFSFLVLFLCLFSQVLGVITPAGLSEEEDDEYRRLYEELLPGVEQLLNETFQSPQARALQDIALRKYKDAKALAEKEDWRKSCDLIKASYDFLSEAVRVEESYLQELTIALMVVLPILVLFHVAYLIYRRHRRLSRR